MKIRRRSHPTDPRKSAPNSNAGGNRMRRHGTPLWNSVGDVIDVVAIQATIDAKRGDDAKTIGA